MAERIKSSQRSSVRKEEEDRRRSRPNLPDPLRDCFRLLDFAPLDFRSNPSAGNDPRSARSFPFSSKFLISRRRQHSQHPQRRRLPIDVGYRSTAIIPPRVSAKSRFTSTNVPGNRGPAIGSCSSQPTRLDRSELDARSVASRLIARDDGYRLLRAITRAPVIPDPPDRSEASRGLAGFFTGRRGASECGDRGLNRGPRTILQSPPPRGRTFPARSPVIALGKARPTPRPFVSRWCPRRRGISPFFLVRDDGSCVDFT